MDTLVEKQLFTMEKKVIGMLPFKGEWLVSATPAKRMPSHGTTLFGVTYAYDFFRVNDKGRSSNKLTWRTLISKEDPVDFYCFDLPVFAPVSGRIVAVHCEEEDNDVRRSLPAGIPYMMKQAQRIAGGPANIAGNYIMIQDDKSKQYVVIVHLKARSITCEAGAWINAGEEVGRCGNSGNSTQPHIHIQAMNHHDFYLAQGVPLFFCHYYEKKKQDRSAKLVDYGIPAYKSQVFAKRKGLS